MSTPVYTQAPFVKNRPMARKDAQGNIILPSFGDMAQRYDLDGGANVVYKGLARPGAVEGSLVWQIQKMAYSGSTVTSVTWPQNPSGVASSEFQFSWTARASYTYS